MDKSLKRIAQCALWMPAAHLNGLRQFIGREIDVDRRHRSRLLQVLHPPFDVLDLGLDSLELFVDGEPMTLARWPDADQNYPAPSITGDRVEVFGTLTPDVTGIYLRNGEQDGVSSFARAGLVDNLQYNLHRRTWEWEGAMHTAWFLTTTESGYPTNDDPWWSFYDYGFGTMNPSNGATGHFDGLCVEEEESEEQQQHAEDHDESVGGASHDVSQHH